MAGPYGAPPYKLSSANKESKAEDGTGEELNDTEWPLEKTLPLPRSYTNLTMKREEEEGNPKAESIPQGVLREITMITTPRSVVITTPDPRNGLSKIEIVSGQGQKGQAVYQNVLEFVTEKKEERPPPPDPKPARQEQENRFAALMRARPPTVHKSEFDPLLQCPHCKRRVVEPKVLCCQRLCQTCLQQEIDATSRDGIMWCKLCGNTILIPDPKQPQRTWARQFDTDTFLVNLKEAVVQLEGKRLCFVCSSRNLTMAASNYCFDCATYFCDPCTESHRHMPNQKNHRVKKVGQITATELMKQKKRFCRTHDGVPLDLYCNVHKTPMCQECATSVHQSCGSITTVAKLAAEKKEKLKTAEKVLEVGLSKCEHNTKRIQTETAELDLLKEQTMKEIDGSFSEVYQALEGRKTKLKKDINDHFSSDGPIIEDTKKRHENLMTSMKSKTDFLQQLMHNASDFDILQCADNVFTSAENITTQNMTMVETPRPKVVVKIDDKAVKNFVELVSLLGAEVGSTQVKGILLKKITTKMKGDQYTPDIRDIFLADTGHLVAVDNKNACVKSIQISGDNFITKRLELSSEPWGGTKLQPGMMAVTGLKLIYIITLSDQLSLQTSVKTRKDYWGISAISPINLACSCKYPPSVDIVDITGRRLRSIEEDHLGHLLFEMPTHIALNGEHILVTDRAKKSLTCVDQEGKVVFVYRGQGDDKLEYPRGICVDYKGRIFLADHDRGCVELISKRGEFLCQVISASMPRTLCLDNNSKTLYLSTEGKALTFFNLIEVQT